MITSLSEFRFRCKIFTLLIQTKEVISISNGSSTSSWKPWRRMSLDLIFTMRDRYINSNLDPLTKFSTSSKNNKFKDNLPWNISQMIKKIVPISTRMVTRWAMKRGIPFEFGRKSMETETTTWSDFFNGGKATVEQILVSEEKKSKKAVSDPSRDVNQLSRVVWGR